MKKETEHVRSMPLITPLGTRIDPAGPIVTDPLGSYTGVPEEVLCEPVQDADDL